MSNKKPDKDVNPAPHLFLPQPASQAYESSLRALLSEGSGQPYHALHSLQEAQQDPIGVVILEGDEGGRIYVVPPARLVQCSHETLQQLLYDIDALDWNDPRMTHLCYERQPVGAAIAGGCGGGLVTDGIWVHERLEDVAESICNVNSGIQPHLNRNSP